MFEWVCLQAVDVDGGEVTVWYQMALSASSLGNLLLARTALDEVLEILTVEFSYNAM